MFLLITFSFDLSLHCYLGLPFVMTDLVFLHQLIRVFFRR